LRRVVAAPLGRQTAARRPACPLGTRAHRAARGRSGKVLVPALALLDPRWLWGLIALAVPLAIHLLSRGPARRVAVGSIALLRVGTSRRPRRWRFTEPGLAAVRGLLIATVVLALAAPHALPRTVPAVWGLVGAEVWATLPHWRRQAPAIASRLEALAAGGALHLLRPGLPAVTSSPATSSDRGPDTESGSTDVDRAAAGAGGSWSLLLEAEAMAPEGTRFAVFTHGTVGELLGARPALTGDVTWTAVRPSPASWTLRAVAQGGGLRRWIARSDRWQTAVSQAAGSSVEGSSVGGSSVAAAPLPLARPLRIVLLSQPQRAADAGYVAAAIAAASDAGFLPVTVDRATLTSSAADASRPVPAADIAVWLSATDVPSAWRTWAHGGRLLVRDARGDRYRDCDARLSLPEVLHTVVIRRCAERAPTAADGNRMTAALWRDHQGRPLLSVAAGGGMMVFAGRFHPAWSDLVGSPAFVAWWAALLDQRARALGIVTAMPARDRRQARAEDRQPGERPRRLPRMVAVRTDADAGLGELLWVLAAVLLVTERVWAQRRWP